MHFHSNYNVSARNYFVATAITKFNNATNLMFKPPDRLYMAN